MSFNSILEVKSKYDAEFRRIGLNRLSISKFDEFYNLLERLHGLYGIQFNICYTDKDGDLLPINNDCNLARVLQVTMGVLRLIILRKGECYPDANNLNHYTNMSYSNTGLSNPSYRATNFIKNQFKELTSHNHNTYTNSLSYSTNNKPFVISYPEDFRPVSAIIDVDILPDTYRRVRLHKHKSSKPLGFYIRDGRSLRVTPHGVEQVPGIFISRLMPGGLAESTGLLSVNDEVIEVNGIEVAGKTLDQVTDMMVANSSNLIITVKPTNQKYNLNRTNLSNNSQSVMNKTNNLPVLNNNSINTNKSNSISSSSVNSSFSSVTNTNNQNKLSLKSINQENTNNNKKITDSNQIVLDLKNSNDITNKTSNTNNTSNNNKANKKTNLDESDQYEFDDEDDDDDDEEIHDATNNQDNSDDKILTL